MKIVTLLFSLLVSSFFVSCNNSNNAIKTEQTTTGEQVASFGNLDCLNAFKKAKKNDSILLHATNFNKIEAENAIVAFNEFTSTCKGDSLAPVFLVKAGQVAQSVGKYTQALSFFEKCINQYPNFKNRGVAMFLLAQLFDDSKMLNNEEEAKILYEKIIKEYPQTEWAINANACIQNLGKTDEQLIQEFMRKEKK